MDVIAAEDALRRARAWARVTDKIAPHFSDGEQKKVLDMLYDEHLTQAEVAEKCYMDRQTVRRIRTRYVCHAAIAAAELGLIHWAGGDDNA